jgi:YVTN family beta-propeller protein
VATAAALVTVATLGGAGRALAAPDAGAAASARGMTHGAKGCIAVVATIHVGRAPGGVASDRRTGTVYVANDSSNTVSVISARTDTVTATIPVGRSPQGVAVDPQTDTVYATNRVDNAVSVINGRTNTVTATITVGRDPESVAASSRTGTAYVADKGANTVSVLGPCPS